MSLSVPHVPVLLDEVVDALAIRPGDVVIDATFGAGGYTRAFLDAGAIVHAFDRDPDAIAAAQHWAETKEQPARLVLHPRRFSEMVEAMDAAGIARVDGIAMDIGVSSMQLDQGERGFAFSVDGPLDMRMDRQRPNAADFVNEAGEGEIADVLYQYGEERQSRRVARAIVAARPLATTGELASVVRKALGYRPYSNKGSAPKDPATRSFQAIRIHVNGELDELAAGLSAAETLLREGGRLAVVSFHSLEDRMVKRFLRDAANANARGSRHLPITDEGEPARFADLGKAIRPSRAETERNPRARSATLRSATRTSAPPRPERGQAA